MKVTGLTPNVQVTVTVGSTQDGYVPGSSTITGASLLAAHTPEFEAVIRTTDGFKAKIKDYGTYQWGATINQGSPGSVDIVTGASTTTWLCPAWPPAGNAPRRQ